MDASNFNISESTTRILDIKKGYESQKQEIDTTLRGTLEKVKSLQSEQEKKHVDLNNLYLTDSPPHRNIDNLRRDIDNLTNEIDANLFKSTQMLNEFWGLDAKITQITDVFALMAKEFKKESVTIRSIVNDFKYEK